MKCFRCNNLDFDIVKHSLFGLPLVGCSHCNQTFLIKDKLELTPVEMLGNLDDIAVECIIVECNFCPTQRYIAVDCDTINMMSCALCNVTTEPVGEKLSWEEFLNKDN